MIRETPRQRVLLVEDDPDLLEIMSYVVSGRLNLEVEGHRGSETAMTALETASYDCLILDVQIPGPIDGITLLRHARTTPRNTLAVAIVMSGNPDLRHEVNRADLDPVHFLIKPFSPDDLAQFVSRALGLSGPSATRKEVPS